ncbi:hypothetical protein JRC04_27755 [Mycolicibacterium sp. S2-37]|uniref:hypothetical protein n=1 Tax=Mycolicibacterium sp. S2-37 TaxID=2810297 RepID=UPI001A94FE68|nr:hypothetical protein [Mycolicibacterium sp. S2-37]MBO0681276.1 hypothetical protein [Mycolicibacterium sp. S2-37]
MGRHSKVSDRRRSSLLMIAFATPAAAALTLGADVNPIAAEGAEPVVEAPSDCCGEVLAAGGTVAPAVIDDIDVVPGQLVSISNWRASRAQVRQALPEGRAPEDGLQVRTIFTARAVSAVFPEIQNIGGVRADALRWHPDGLALDVMIPDPGSDAGIALGNQIVAYVLKNAERFGIQDVIWRGVYYTPSGPQSFGAGHYDHVHITTTGGGYPTGEELYFR